VAKAPAMSDSRLSICYAAPGLNLLPTAGPTRNVLSVAEALGQWADVTVAFRHVSQSIQTDAYGVMAIEPSGTGPTAPKDDTATRGFHPLRHLAYCRALQAFARQHASVFDVVLEKGWRLSGFLSAAFVRAGVPAVLVENAVSLWIDPVNDLQSLGKYLLYRSADALTNFCTRRVPLVIAETEELKDAMVVHRGIAADRIKVIRLGLDHHRFRPMPQQAARESLGISGDATVLVYVGGIDEYHDLEPLIDALARSARPSVELHVVGNGEYREKLEGRIAATRVKARFYGHVPHATVPQYIAAADLCLAPYRTSAFPGGLVTFATLKIPEYMACARAVVSVPSPAIARLVNNRVNGFLFPNDAASWSGFLKELPSRQQLAAMGEAASAAMRPITWDATARNYLMACEELVSHAPSLATS
jgi:glycosyltransferase involved in cell wall biosynthesis